MLQFDADTHTYVDDGVEIPSVTQILERVGLVNTYFMNQYPEARQRGTDVHEATALIDRGALELGDFDGWMAGWIDSWSLFKIDNAIDDFSHVESRFGSAELGYAGTVDRVAMIDDKPVIIDLKTGKPARTHKLQLAAYAIGLGLMSKDTRRMCVHLTDDGEYKVKEYTDPEDYDDWIALSEYVRVMRKYGK